MQTKTPPDPKVFPNRYRWFSARIGWQVPEIEMQFAPFEWGIGLGYSREKVAICVGPLRVAVWFRFGAFVCDAETDGWSYRP
jgi:hypothetical protein